MFIKLFLELPVKGILAIADKLSEQFDREMDEEEQIRKEMVKLNLLYEMDEINEEEYEEHEFMLLQRLKKSDLP